MNTKLLLGVLILYMIPSAVFGVLPAFPGAEGFGALVTGGRGHPAYAVTTLEDYHPEEKPIPGSLRHALSEPNRTIVFRVGGVIRLKANLSVPSNVTIAGQTAPGEGISLYGRTLSLSGSDNIIIRYIRTRQGIEGDRGRCSINIAGGSNIILDHLSIQWGRWNALGLTVRSRYITVQNCIIGEAIDPQRFGALVDEVENVTLARNLWIHNHTRNPKAKGTIEYINNVIYNWGVTGLVGGRSAKNRELDVINNYMIAGPSSQGLAIGRFAVSDHVYHTGNFVDLDRDGRLGGRPVVDADFHPEATFVTRRFLRPTIPVTEEAAQAAYERAVKYAGASLRRDAVDRRLIEDLVSLGTRGQIIRSEAEVGGHPDLEGGQAPLDTDGDGMPDEWEAEYGLDSRAAPDAARDKDGDGYTNLEEYLNGTDPRQAIDYSKRQNNINTLKASDINKLTHGGYEMLYQSSMGDAESLKGWVMEGPGKVEFADGWMTMYSPDKKGHFVYWCPKVFPASFIAEWDAQCLDTELGLCIVFFAATGPNGEDIFDPNLPKRDGLFPQYTMGLRCYHISYYANTPDEPNRATTNMRKNPGSHIVAQGPPAIPPHSTAIHRVRLTKDGAHIKLSVDGRPSIDWTDDGKQFGPVLGAGHIGLRQMQWTRFRYRNFRVMALPAER